VIRTVRFALVATLVGFCAAGAVAAATSGPTAGANPAEKRSDDEVLEQSSTSIDQMQDTLKQGIDRLEQARGEKDLMRYNCINAKVKAIRGLVQIGELSGQALREAIGAKSPELIHHNVTKIDLARARVEAFRVEIEGCVGEQSQYTGGTEVESTIDSDIRQDDPTEGDILAGEPIDIDRPFPATLAY
jgi:hypothetical protein